MRKHRFFIWLLSFTLLTSVFAAGLAAASAPEFTDVSGWYAGAVTSLVEKGVMTGYSDGTFRPNGPVTRGMFVTLLYRLSGASGSSANPFSDVPAGSWYENAIAWAAENGLVQGVGGQRFAPDRCITREQYASILWNYAKYKGIDVSIGEDTNILSYNEAFSISDFAFPGLQWACGAGIIDGDTMGNLNPRGCATRAQVAVMLERFLTAQN